MKVETQKIANLESMRFLFALMIFFHHFMRKPQMDEILFPAGGSCAVAFFFMLSGFVMAMGYGRKVSLPSFSYRNYMVGRLVRIYPLHLLCLALALGAYVYTNHLGGLPMSWGDMKIYLPNLILLQTWIPLRTVYYGCNDVAWFLANTLFFYALFPMVVRFIHRLSGRQLVLAVIIILVIYCLMLPCVSVQNAHWVIYICPLARSLDFVWGIVLYRLFAMVEKKDRLMDRIHAMSVTAKTVVEFSTLLLVAVTLLLHGVLPEKWCLVSLYWPTMFILIFVFAIAGKYNGGLISRSFENRFFCKFGALSFTFYMIHFMVIRVLHTLILAIGIHCPLSLQLLLCLSMGWGIAYMVNRFYEKPVTRYLKSKIK